MATASECIFCKIVRGEIPSLTVYEDDACLAFLDIGPLADGHTLLIPKTHAETLDGVAPDVAARLGRLLPRLGAAVRTVSGAEGFNVLQNNGAAAGQEVRHVHFHLIPRRAEDGLGYRWKPRQYAEGQAELIAQQLSSALGDAG